MYFARYVCVCSRLVVMTASVRLVGLRVAAVDSASVHTLMLVPVSTLQPYCSTTTGTSYVAIDLGRQSMVRCLRTLSREKIQGDYKGWPESTGRGKDRRARRCADDLLLSFQLYETSYKPPPTFSDARVAAEAVLYLITCADNAL